MVIDFHTHYYPEKIRVRVMTFCGRFAPPVLDGSRRALEEDMRLAGVDFSVGLPVAGVPGKSRSVSEWALGENHGVIRMFGSIHPEDPDWREVLDFIAGNGLPGIKLHPEYQQFRLDDPRFYPIWERCQDLGLIVLSHAGWDPAFPPPYRTDPEHLAAFCGRFPGLKLVLAHLGSLRMWDAVGQYLAGLPVWFDTAMIDAVHLPPDRLLRIIRTHGAGRILFGSDSPWCGARQVLELLRSLPLKAEEWSAITGGNALRLLQMENSFL